MPESRFLIAVGGTLAGLGVFVGLAAVVAQPLLVFVAIPLFVAGYLIWFHGTGRMEFRTRVRAERASAEEATFRTGNRRRRSASDDDGPRWTDPEWRRRREQARRAAREARGRGGGRRTRQGDPSGRRRTAAQVNSGPTPREAYRVLDLDPDSTTEEVKAAYRRKVKEVHPDTEGGDEEAFKRVTEAYETLSDRAS